MKLSTALSALAIVLSALALGFVALSPSSEVRVGANAGPDFYERAYFLNDATLGGTNFATSSVGAGTYTAASIINNKTITHTAASALTATLPASSTLQTLVPRVGDTATRYILPVTTGFTLAGGTGTDLNTASSTKFCVAGQVCRLDFVRKSNSDIEVLLTNPSGN